MKKRLKGYMNFAYVENDLQYYIEDHPMELNIIGDVMTGKEFYETVNTGCIMDSDGILADVYINGYKSNLGLTHKYLHQGGFMVDGESWLELCDEFDIEVEWCNK